MKTFRRIQDWGKHHHIELFGILLGTLVLVLLINSISICVYASRENDKVLSEKAIFAHAFVTSLSGKEGSISQLYVNNDRTKCVLLYKFTDMNDMITDASKYQVFIKSFDVFKGDYSSRGTTRLSVDGGYYVFGSTGYSALYLSAVNGFHQDAYEVIVRCNEVLRVQDTENENAKNDASYAKYDQWRVIVNPNGNDAKVCDFLDDFNITSLYQDAVIDNNESQVRDKLLSDISIMYEQKKMIDSYKQNLKSMNVQIPSLPVSMADDQFEVDEEGLIRYKSGYKFENGVDYDWYDKTLHDVSFLDMVRPSDMTDIQFFNSLNNYQAQASNLTSDKWYMEDGSEIVFDDSNLKFNNMQSIKENITRYNEAVTNYYNAKKSYHCTDLVNYLYLEYEMNNAGKYFTSNYSDGVVTVW